MVHEPRAEEYVRYGIFDWGESARDVFLDFMSKHLRMVHVAGGVFLFEIADEPIAPAERRSGMPLYLKASGVATRVNDLVGKADFLFKRGRLEEGKAVAQEMVRLAPEVSLAYSYRGYANSLLDLDQEAISDYEKAVRLGYPTPSVYYNLAILLEKNGKLKRALEVQMEVIRMEPALTRSKERAASLALALGRRDLALSLARELKAGGSRDPDFQRRVETIMRAAAEER
jgi:tetratricopeptide (TPR) repeat protein